METVTYFAFILELDNTAEKLFPQVLLDVNSTV